MRFDGFAIPLVIVALLAAAQFLHHGLKALAATGDGDGDGAGGDIVAAAPGVRELREEGGGEEGDKGSEAEVPATAAVE
mgnify:CR=1 FL=1